MQLKFKLPAAISAHKINSITFLPFNLGEAEGFGNVSIL